MPAPLGGLRVVELAGLAPGSFVTPFVGDASRHTDMTSTQAPSPDYYLPTMEPPYCESTDQKLRAPTS